MDGVKAQPLSAIEIAHLLLHETILQGKEQLEDEKYDLMRRQTVAAEASATAAQTSARLALISAIISVAMLLVTAWPYMRLVGLLSELTK